MDKYGKPKHYYKTLIDTIARDAVEYYKEKPFKPHDSFNMTKYLQKTLAKHPSLKHLDVNDKSRDPPNPNPNADMIQQLVYEDRIYQQKKRKYETALKKLVNDVRTKISNEELDKISSQKIPNKRQRRMEPVALIEPAGEKAVVEDKENESSGTGLKKQNPWIIHVKEYAKNKGISYSEAMKDVNCKSSYKK